MSPPRPRPPLAVFPACFLAFGAHAEEPEAPDPDDVPVLEVTVAASPEDDARRSTEAVTVVDLTEARTQTADLGEQLARTEGVTLQRTGGLGSSQRLRLDGLGDDQVRVFVDGVPLAYTGLATTLADVPLDLVTGLEVHHGVVPLRFGADALGGAIALHTAPPTAGVHGRAAWQAGSWDTHRAAAEVRWFHAPRGVGVHGAGFFDASANDWPIDVEVADLSGRLSPAVVRRRHAAYRAGGGR
ncbi:MAG: TonB-dependent receptor plug domain-containing protein, partial [Myxococcales bacterium]|nr:TonB-dependent receptor plug domain-containing protein [Myxococcales bacterium]